MINKEINNQWNKLESSLIDLGHPYSLFMSEYFQRLKTLRLPPILKKDEEIFIIESVSWKKGQFFVSLSDGKFYHGSVVKKISDKELKTLQRNKNIESILE